jgi:hypothetical protein
VADRAYINRMLVGDVYIAGAVANAIARGAPMGTVAMMGAIHTGKIEVRSRGARRWARWL